MKYVELKSNLSDYLIKNENISFEHFQNNSISDDDISYLEDLAAKYTDFMQEEDIKEHRNAVAIFVAMKSEDLGEKRAKALGIVWGVVAEHRTEMSYLSMIEDIFSTECLSNFPEVIKCMTKDNLINTSLFTPLKGGSPQKLGIL
jgi:hypothetical protein